MAAASEWVLSKKEDAQTAIRALIVCGMKLNAYLMGVTNAPNLDNLLGSIGQMYLSYSVQGAGFQAFRDIRALDVCALRAFRKFASELVAQTGGFMLPSASKEMLAACTNVQEKTQDAISAINTLAVID
jgi:hypothetical protein